MKQISENTLRRFINELKEENSKRNELMKTASEYGHTALVHSYNVTIDHISKLEKLIKDAN